MVATPPLLLYVYFTILTQFCKVLVFTVVLVHFPTCFKLLKITDIIAGITAEISVFLLAIIKPPRIGEAKMSHKFCMKSN